MQLCGLIDLNSVSHGYDSGSISGMKLWRRPTEIALRDRSNGGIP